MHCFRGIIKASPITRSFCQVNVAKSKSSYENFRFMMKKYGPLAIGTYLGIYGVTLGSIFLALNYDVCSASTFGFEPKTLIQNVRGI